MLNILFQIGAILVLVLILMRVFRRTPGIFAFGVFVLVLTGALALADYWDLEIIERLIQASSTVLVLAFVVIFQPELRHMLAGLASKLKISHGKQQAVAIEKIVQGLEYLKERRFGALIAIEQGMGNLAVRESGVALNAEVSEELIGSAFTDKTPLHDGAMLIQDDKVLAAACIFPVTERQDLDRLLGLRHRAALGYSESTDSVVVVLSEETGAYSIAYRGELERGLDVGELRKRLIDLLHVKKSAGKRQVKASKEPADDPGNVRQSVPAPR